VTPSGPRTRTASDRVALTFDDGPDPRHTPRMLDRLAEEGVRATFFLIGREARRHPPLVRRIVEEGHELGMHGWSHRHPWLLSPEGLRNEMARGTAALVDITGRRPRWYRPPFGRMRPALAPLVRAYGQEVVLWSRSARDWGPWGTPGQIRRRLLRAAPGDIVLMHDGRNRINRPGATLQALDEVLEGWRRRGFRFGAPDA
jgi:peptidoglycan-N-acetylglucosamine deacetylase